MTKMSAHECARLVPSLEDIDTTLDEGDGRFIGRSLRSEYACRTRENMSKKRRPLHFEGLSGTIERLREVASHE